jgi:hypothetical protein
MCIGMANGGKIMTPQKALNRLDETVTGNLEWKIVLSNALEKRIPKKPIRAHRIIKKNGMFILRDDNEYWKCPICIKADVVLLKNQKHCHDCGQALDWSDTDEQNDR